MTKYSENDLLHCVVSTADSERVTLVSPYQRGGLETGRPISIPKTPGGPPGQDQGEGGDEDGQGQQQEEQ